MSSLSGSHDLSDLVAGDASYRALLANISDVVAIIDGEGVIEYVSPAVRQVLGVEPEALIGLTVGSLLQPHQRDVEEALATAAEDDTGRTIGPLRVSLNLPDGRSRSLEVVMSNRLHDPAIAGVVVTARDVTERHASERLRARETSVLEAIARSVAVETVLERISRLVEDELDGACCSVGMLEDDGVIRHHTAPTLSAEIVNLLDRVEPASVLGVALRAPGIDVLVFDDIAVDARWGEDRTLFAESGLSSCWIFTVREGGTGALLGAVTAFHAEARGPNIDEVALLDRCRHLAAIAIERRRFEARLEHQALHDHLTGLPNRTLLLDRIAQALARSARHEGHVAVLFLDLDHFKVINDSLGHAAGDRLLEQVADRLRREVRAGDTVGRFGGDEFVVLCEEVDGENGATDIARRLSVAQRLPFVLDSAEVVVTASIGIALASAPATTPEDLIRDADAAMYRAKAQGRDGYALADKDLHRRMVQRLEQERSLRAAVSAGELTLYYQPRVRLSDNAITGVEALVRWDQGGVTVGAGEIVPLAEETGLIVPLGAWALGEACRQVAGWDAVVPGPPMAVLVNVSGRQLADPDLLQVVSTALEAAGLEPSRLCLEVTESTLAADNEVTVSTLGRLKALGVRLAIDDFGTGYATLDYLRRFSMADELKIDRSFVAGLDHFHSADAAIVAAAVVLADALGFETVAEGVETGAQLEVLRRLGCNQAQGFYFSPPLPAGELLPLLMG